MSVPACDMLSVDIAHFREAEGGLTVCSGLTAGRLTLALLTHGQGSVEVLIGGWLSSATSAAALLDGSK